MIHTKQIKGISAIGFAMLLGSQIANAQVKDTGGDVGIGTTGIGYSPLNPQHKLHVYTDDNNSGLVFKVQQKDSRWIGMGHGSGDSNSVFTTIPDHFTWLGQSTTDIATGGLALVSGGGSDGDDHYRSGITFWTGSQFAPVQNMNLNKDGNLGLGDFSYENPDSKFHIKADNGGKAMLVNNRFKVMGDGRLYWGPKVNDLQDGESITGGFLTWDFPQETEPYYKTIIGAQAGHHLRFKVGGRKVMEMNPHGSIFTEASTDSLGHYAFTIANNGGYGKGLKIQAGGNKSYVPLINATRYNAPNSSLFVVNTRGQVGIGTTNINMKEFYVSKNIEKIDQYKLFVNGPSLINGGINAEYALRLYNGAGDGGGIYVKASAGGYKVKLLEAENNYGQSQFRVNAYGQVGIGIGIDSLDPKIDTISGALPAKLYVKGSIESHQIRSTGLTVEGGEIRVESSEGNGSDATMYWKSSVDSKDHFKISIDESEGNNAIFATSTNGSSWDHRMEILGNGYLFLHDGLEVAGDIIQNGKKLVALEEHSDGLVLLHDNVLINPDETGNVHSPLTSLGTAGQLEISHKAGTNWQDDARLVMTPYASASAYFQMVSSKDRSMRMRGYHGEYLHMHDNSNFSFGFNRYTGDEEGMQPRGQIDVRARNSSGYTAQWAGVFENRTANGVGIYAGSKVDLADHILHLRSAETDGSHVDAMVVRSSGIVGIGTAYPDQNYALTVAGKIKTKELRITQLGWADFVFEDDYKLKPLEEVEQFIDQNGHLPDVPSAKEVEENGINAGEMDATLLQKIEELTLYMIEMKKENKELRAELETLKAGQNK